MKYRRFSGVVFGMQAGVELYRTNHWWYLIYYTPCYAALYVCDFKRQWKYRRSITWCTSFACILGCRTVQDEAVFELLSRASVS